MVAATQELSFLLMWLLLLLLLSSLSWFVREGLGLVGWGWSVLLWAFRIGVGGLGLVGRSLR